MSPLYELAACRGVPLKYFYGFSLAPPSWIQSAGKTSHLLADH